MKKRYIANAVAATLLLTGAVTLLFGNKSWPFILYINSRITDGKLHGFHGIEINTPSMWWILEKKNNNLIFSRVPYDRNSRSLFLTVSLVEKDRIRAFIEELQNSSPTNKGQLHLKRPSSRSGFFDYLWLIPNKNILITGMEYLESEVKFAEDFVSNIN